MQDIAVNGEHADDEAAQSSEAGPIRESSRNAVRRAVKACVQCKSRKQRCSGPSSIPCVRCAASKRPCSFTFSLDDALRDDAAEGSAVASLDLSVRTLAEIRHELSMQRQRIETLEALLGAGSHDDLNGHDTFSPSPPGDAMAAESLEALQHHQAGSWPGPDNNGDASMELPSLRGVQMNVPYSVLSSMDKRKPPDMDRRRQDPVKAGLIDMAEAQAMFDIFWTQCHPMCAVLDCATQKQAFAVCSASPFLFTLVCSIASRFWIVPETNLLGLHPKYWSIVEMADRQISEVILQPKSFDIRLETLQALLLYCQYSPLQPLGLDGARTRFSDSGNSLLISSALRLGRILQLQERIQRYPRDVSEATPDDMRHMRVFINLVSVDHIISLSANLTPSIDPSTSVRAVRNFAGHPNSTAQDSRMAGLFEVVLIVHRIAQDPLQRPLSQTGTGILRRVNEELEEWERQYLSTRSSAMDEIDRHGTFPLTTSRWYRLVLNSSSAGLYSPSLGESLKQQLEKESLVTAVNAAAETIWRFSVESLNDPVGGGWRKDFPHPLTVNITRASTLAHSTDSYWLTHSFAGALLAIAFDRGVIDANLTILDDIETISATVSSPLRRLLTLAVALVESVLSFSLHHPASAYLPYFKAALHTCTPVSTPVAAPAITDALPPVNGATVPNGQDQSLDALLQMMGQNNEQFNLDAFRDTIFSQPWDASWANSL